MSTYRKPGRAHYFYDFQVGGRRYSGSTGKASKREADAVEARKRKEAAVDNERRQALGREPMTFRVACVRYWDEVGSHSRTSRATIDFLAWLQSGIGAEKRLAEINDNVVARLIARRRGEAVKAGRTLRPATLNRTVTEPLRRVLRRAAVVWGEQVGTVDWKHHLLREPQERVRELRTEEEIAMFAALRPDYHPVVRFALITGCRLNECVTLAWSDVDWGGRQVWINGKGGKRAPIPLPPSVRDLLWPLQGQHAESVFTYVADRAAGGRRKGERHPITYEGLKTAFRRDVKPVVPGYRFHDNRHTAATRLLRSSGNVRIVKEMLRHADIATTMKYAHVTNDDVLSAMEVAFGAPPPLERPTRKVARRTKP